MNASSYLLSISALVIMVMLIRKGYNIYQERADPDLIFECAGDYRSMLLVATAMGCRKDNVQRIRLYMSRGNTVIFVGQCPEFYALDRFHDSETHAFDVGIPEHSAILYRSEVLGSESSENVEAWLVHFCLALQKQLRTCCAEVATSIRADSSAEELAVLGRITRCEPFSWDDLLKHDIPIEIAALMVAIRRTEYVERILG